VTLVQAVKALDAFDVKALTQDEQVGYKIVKRSLEEPMRQIVENAGLDGAVVVDRAKKEKKGFGFDAAKMEWFDMFARGIIDPAKVTRSALQNAASIAGLLLTTEVTVTDIPEKEPAGPAMPPGGGGMPPY